MLIKLPNGWWVDPSKVTDIHARCAERDHANRVVIISPSATIIINAETFAAASESADAIAAAFNKVLSKQPTP